MPQYKRPCLIVDQLGYEIVRGRTLFKSISASIFPEDCIALIGENGIGKSTLLQCLAGLRQSHTGAVSRQCTLAYVAQNNLLNSQSKDLSVLDFLTKTAESWWEIEHYLETTFATTLSLSASMHSLSGGELMKLSLAIALWRNPDLLLLDEPTNHLDYTGLEQLRHALCLFTGALVVVSHKTYFIDQTTATTWELTASGLQVYGGNYSFYREQKEIAAAAAVRSHETARKVLKHTKATVLKEQKRAAQSIRNGGRYVLLNREARGPAGTMRNWAEQTAGRLKVKHERAMNAAAQKVDQTKVYVPKATCIQIESPSPQHRHLIEVSHADLYVGQQRLLSDINFQIVSGQRVAIAGPNGSGKSSLIKAMLKTSDDAVLKGGYAQLAEMKVVYLDQNYTLIDRDQTILENMHRANSALPYQLIRQQLGHFLFFNDDVDKPANVLSGGELARLAIAMLTISALDLLILDEPTNNLDIETVDHIVAGLTHYKGALCVISHDLCFLSRIGVKKSFKLTNASFHETTYLPQEKARYSNELVSC